MKMKTLVAATAAFTLSAGLFAPSVVLAEQDFAQYTNEELVQQRTQVRDMSEGDRALFQAEMQKRTQTMSAEERTRLGVDGRGQAAQDGQMRQRTSEDNDRGQGKMQRERQRSESGGGYGSGYGTRQGGGVGGGGGGGTGGGKR